MSTSSSDWDDHRPQWDEQPLPLGGDTLSGDEELTIGCPDDDDDSIAESKVASERPYLDVDEYGTPMCVGELPMVGAQSDGETSVDEEDEIEEMKALTDDLCFKVNASLCADPQGVTVEQFATKFCSDWSVDRLKFPRLFRFPDFGKLLKSELLEDYVQEEYRNGKLLYSAKALPNNEQIVRFLADAHLSEEQEIQKRKTSRLVKMHRPENSGIYIEGKRRILELLKELHADKEPVLYSKLQERYLVKYECPLDGKEHFKFFMCQKASSNLNREFYNEVDVLGPPLKLKLKSADVEVPSLEKGCGEIDARGMLTVPRVPMKPLKGGVFHKTSEPAEASQSKITTTTAKATALQKNEDGGGDRSHDSESSYDSEAGERERIRKKRSLLGGGGAKAVRGSRRKIEDLGIFTVTENNGKAEGDTEKMDTNNNDGDDPLKTGTDIYWERPKEIPEKGPLMEMCPNRGSSNGGGSRRATCAMRALMNSCRDSERSMPAPITTVADCEPSRFARSNNVGGDANRMAGRGAVDRMAVAVGGEIPRASGFAPPNISASQITGGMSNFGHFRPDVYHRVEPAPTPSVDALVRIIKELVRGRAPFPSDLGKVVEVLQRMVGPNVSPHPFRSWLELVTQKCDRFVKVHGSGNKVLLLPLPPYM